MDEAIHRLRGLASEPDLVSKIPLGGLSDKVAALNGLERWLEATGSARLQLDAALESLPALRRLLLVLSASDPLANSLVQNPGLASLFFEEAIPNEPFQSGWFQNEAHRLLQSITSTSHLLDRLRYLKQKITLEIAARDLGKEQPQPQIWRLLSELADGLLELAVTQLWNRFRIEYDLPIECPLAVIAMGKLGSGELNYSSDVDLVFVVKDALDWEIKKKIDRFATHVVHALAETMGRGRLYRVDLRLRPFGGVGEIAPSLAAFEKYIANYAEPWEILALTRARCIGDPDRNWFAPALAELKRKFCYRNEWSEASIGSLIEMRDAIDAFAEPDDFKRGAGGIRDVEFIAQIFQLLLTSRLPNLDGMPTLSILMELEKEGVISRETARSLSVYYCFLRKLEHRCQILGDQQTHCLPASEASREKVAKLMDCGTVAKLEQRLAEALHQNRAHYLNQIEKWTLVAEPVKPTHLSEAVLNWLNRFPLRDSFVSSVQMNPEAVNSLNNLAELAPGVVTAASTSLSLTEAILGAESFVDRTGNDAKQVMDSVPVDENQSERLGTIMREHGWGLVTEWVHEQDFSLPSQLLKLAQEYILTLCERCGLLVIPTLSIYLLGAFAREEASIESDLDVIFLLDSSDSQPEAEAGVQTLLRLAEESSRYGSPFAIDLRLRPEGKQGLMVRTIEGMRNYGRTEMEMWERFAIGQCLPIRATESASFLIYDLGFGLPLTPHRLEELLAIKKRIEVERVSDDAQYRDVKLGRGSLGDIEWMVHLMEMRYPLATRAGETARMLDRIDQLGKAGLLHVGEVAELKEGHQFMLRMKQWLNLQLGKSSVRPENPDKLLKLAKAMGFEEGNQLLEAHLFRAKRIRQMFEETIMRLQGKQGQ